MKDKIDYKTAYETAMMGLKMQMQEIERLKEELTILVKDDERSQETIINLGKENEELNKELKKQRNASNVIIRQQKGVSERAKKRINFLIKERERLNNIIKTKDEGIKALTEDLCDTTKELEEGYERIKGLEVASSKLDYESTIYANRIDKAIEYIEHAQNYGLTKQVMPQMRLYINGDDVLDILKGEDNE